MYIYLDSENPDEKNVIRFFKNGIDQGAAFVGAAVPHGVYLPAISLYKRARARANFGPSFIYQAACDSLSATAVSEVMPMSHEDRVSHEVTIARLRKLHGSNPNAIHASSKS